MTPDYAAILRRDLMSFIDRSFYELNPQTELLLAPHLELFLGGADRHRDVVYRPEAVDAARERG